MPSPFLCQSFRWETATTPSQPPRPCGPLSKSWSKVSMTWCHGKQHPCHIEHGSLHSTRVKPTTNQHLLWTFSTKQPEDWNIMGYLEHSLQIFKRSWKHVTNKIKQHCCAVTIRLFKHFHQRSHVRASEKEVLFDQKTNQQQQTAAQQQHHQHEHHEHHDNNNQQKPTTTTTTTTTHVT